MSRLERSDRVGLSRHLGSADELVPRAVGASSASGGIGRASAVLPSVQIGFLRYLKFRFWLLLFAVDIALLIGWLSDHTAASFVIGLWLAPVALAVMVLPDIVTYLRFT